MVNKKKAHEDKWLLQQIHKTFPQNAVRVVGRPNMYVALWTRNNKPIMGQAWNDSGVVQCAFAADKKVFKGMDIEGGTIKLLVYEGNHVTNHFYYEWVPLAKWKVECKSNRERVQCNGSVPIFWKEKAVLGNYDIHEQKASFAVSDSFVEIANLSTLGEMSVLVRNTNGGPPECTCAQCSSDADHASKNQLMVNDWGDFCCGNLWPADKPIMRALNRPLNTPRGPQDHFVALWYRHGKPLMGRAWNDDGKINASFVDSNHEFSGKIIGSLQMLVAMQATAAGFEYCWLPYEQASRYIGKDFAPVHMSYVAPCVIQVDKFEILGSVNLKKERAEASFDGRIITLDGPAIRTLKVDNRQEGRELGENRNETGSKCTPQAINL